MSGNPRRPRYYRGGGGGGGGGGANRPRRDYNSNHNNNNHMHGADRGEATNNAGGNGDHNQSDEPPKKKFDGPVFGFKRLFNFVNKDTPDDVITNIHRGLKDWEILLTQDNIAAEKTLRNGKTEMSDDLLFLIVCVLGEKVCSESSVLSSKQITIVNSAITNRNFHNKISEKCSRFAFSDDDTSASNRRQNNNTEFYVEQTPFRFIQNLHSLFRFVITKMRTTALDNLSKLVPSTLMQLNYLIFQGGQDSEEWKKLFENFKELKTSMDSIKKEAEKKFQEEEIRTRRRKFGLTPDEEDEQHTMEPPDDFREIDIIPSIHELMSRNETTFLRTNKLHGAYNDANHYLDVQFRLLREDFVRPLKDGVQDYMKNKIAYLSRQKRPPIGNVRFYHQVCHVEVKLFKGVMVNTMQLHPDNYKKIKWDKSKRLLTGSLLVFTPDDFVNAYFAIVYQRDTNELEKGILTIQWEGRQPDFTKENEFLMVECEVYFEAYRHTLQILKQLQLEDFPMSKFIVKAHDIVGPPQYMLENMRLMKIGRFEVSPLAELTWPTPEDLSLDEKQFQAYKAGITKEFVIVQGPPGTGKTFLALKVVETLLLNPEIWNNDREAGPIFCCTYTNHALDQFLEGILNIFKKIGEKPSLIRVGGRSKCPALDDYGLARQRVVAQRLQQFDKNYGRMKAEAHERVRKAENNRASLMIELLAMNNLKGIVDFNSLSIIDELKDEIPSEILNELQKPSFFHLDHDFESQRMTDENRLKLWFKVNKKSGADQQSKNPNINFQQQPVPPPRGQLARLGNEDSDEEDYDLEELERDRIVEDIYMRAENETPITNVGENIKYLYDKVKRQYQQEVDGYKREREFIQNNKNEPSVSKRMKIEEVNTRIRENESYLQLIARKESFVQFVFNAYKNKSIDFPDVKRYCMEQGQNDLFEVEQLLRPMPRTREEKWALFFHVLERAKFLTAVEVKKANENLNQAHKELQDVFNHGDGILLSKAKVVGMTTTGASKYNAILRKAAPRIVIVEEAAEVLESHIVTCLTKNCQHLILIGDHQQLRPSTTVYELARQYHLDISLFERMVNNKLHCYKLNQQHRMRPEIASLVVDTIYPELYNAPKVHLYPKVKGVLTNLFFITHNEAESSESDSKSKSNAHEAQFVAALSRYLIQQGYSPEQITVLTTYTGQMFLIKQCMRGIKTCQGIRTTNVDNFQGEENDIIILSLVRSNEQAKIGFLSTDNRICVALSRAKHGLYIIGNMGNLKKNSKTWKKIDEKLNNRDEIGNSLTIECQIHGTIQEVTTNQDFQKLSPEGGCLEPCGQKLNCTHVCGQVCHIQDREHARYKCLQPCLKVCPNGHNCKQTCFKKCPPCPERVTKTLLCDHEKLMQCHEPIESVTCHQKVQRVLPCNHSHEMACFVNPLDFKCKIKVEKALPCSHIKEMECHVDPSSILCKVIMKKTLPCEHTTDAECWKNEESITCHAEVTYKFANCNHEMKMKCVNSKKPGIKCRSACTARISCGHACSLLCHADSDPDHLQYECKKKCVRLCENGQHRCTLGHECRKSCPPCKILVKKVLSCRHNAELECRSKPEDKQCELQCSRTMACGHLCKNLCFQACGPCKEPVTKRSISCPHEQVMQCSVIYTKEECNVKVPMRGSACGHDVVQVPCRKANTITPEECLKYCSYPCDKRFPSCEHLCKGTCSGCLQNRIHKKCEESCERLLPCGHVCDFPCSKVCPPCSKPCQMECEHSKCNRKCGEPCNHCLEKCNWRCPHKACARLCGEPCDRVPCDEPCLKKLECGHQCVGFCGEPCPPQKLECGHQCVGFCGEPCPPQCKICNRSELTEFFLLGNEDEDDARFVLLEDCGHALEREGMECLIIKTNLLF